MYDKGAPYISDFFIFKDEPYNLRGLSTRLDLPPFNLEFMHRSFTFLASKQWNALPLKVRESQDIASFKRPLKVHMAYGVVLENSVNSFSFRFCFEPFLDLFIVNILTVVMNRLLTRNFFIFYYFSIF